MHKPVGGFSWLGGGESQSKIEKLLCIMKVKRSLMCPYCRGQAMSILKKWSIFKIRECVCCIECGKKVSRHRLSDMIWKFFSILVVLALIFDIVIEGDHDLNFFFDKKISYFVFYFSLLNFLRWVEVFLIGLVGQEESNVQVYEEKSRSLAVRFLVDASFYFLLIFFWVWLVFLA